MKMGEIRSSPDGTFIMQTPDGVRDVTLRCTVEGSVEVEEVSGGGLLIKPLMVTQLAPAGAVSVRADVQQASIASWERHGDYS